jgi:hypothetical protein
MPKTGPGVKRPKAKSRRSKQPSQPGRRAAPTSGGLESDDDEADDALGYMARRHSAAGGLESDDDDDDSEEEVDDVMPLQGGLQPHRCGSKTFCLPLLLCCAAFTAC